MKNIFVLIFAAIMIGCSGNPNEVPTNEKTNIASKFITDISSLESYTEKDVNPISQFIEQANKTADESLQLTKANVQLLLTKAQDYQHAVITTGDHTIIKIIDFDDCKQSGSWGTCMPKAKGYIKKGELVPQNDYINNIIGRPDNEERMLFLFK